jgi:chemotaxis protein CheD
MKQSVFSAQMRSSQYIAQGEYAVDSREDSKITTILGSCVATCLWDPDAQVGGMNHFLLPHGSGTGGGVSSFGANAMELLINALIKSGADRRRFRAKVFGGAEMYKGLTSVGSQNAAFVLDYLECEGIPCDGQSLGGSLARRVEFMPAIGAARQKFVEDTVIVKPEPVVELPVTSELELF